MKSGGRPGVFVVDVTNRDGAQSARIILPKLSKTILNLFLSRMGIFQSEIGFPTLKHEVGYINANLALARKGVFDRMLLQGWCRAVPEDIDRAFHNCPGLQHIALSISTSEVMLRRKFSGKRKFDDICRLVQESISRARAHGAKSIIFGAEDASRTETQRLETYILAGKEAGADRFRYSDTLGLHDPLTAYERIGRLAQDAEIPFEMHSHNDLGLAEASSLAAAQGIIEAGLSAFINATVNGYGERAGNSDIISLLLALKFSPVLKKRMHLAHKVDLGEAWNVARYASYAFSLPLPVNQPGVGANAFAHESGIHADGVLKDHRLYELYAPEEIGRGKPEMVETGRSITTGEYGGIKGLRYAYRRLGIEFASDQEARDILEIVQYANMQTQKPLLDAELRFIAEHPAEARVIVGLSSVM